ncbi:MAG TPA: hypothetical protein VH593_15205 [Ktedonobacteraceae bacterium]|jgi:hypothetical protein
MEELTAEELTDYITNAHIEDLTGDNFYAMMTICLEVEKAEQKGETK